MSKMSRDKGKLGEREVIKLLQPVITQVYEAMDMEAPLLQRNLMQSDRGGFDIVGLEWMALEVKRREQLGIAEWWAQTLRQAGSDKEPVLLYRRNNERWRACLYVDLRIGSDMHTVRATLDEAEFLVWFRRRLHYELLS